VGLLGELASFKSQFIAAYLGFDTTDLHRTYLIYNRQESRRREGSEGRAPQAEFVG
jgi:hypothetical protein